MGTVIRVADNAGITLLIERCEHAEFSIGRAWDNDVIVDEPHVCPHHLRVHTTEDGWQITDLDSVNGTHIKGRPAATDTTLQSGDSIRIGNRVISFYSPQHPVPQTRRLYRGYLPFQNWSNGATAICSALICLIYYVLVSFQELSSEPKWLKLTMESSFILLIPLVWAGIWALVGRVNIQHYHYLFHFSIACIILTAMGISGSVSELIEFQTSSILARNIWEYLGDGILLVLIFFLSYSAATRTSRKRQAIYACSTAGSILLLSFLFSYADDNDFSAHPQYSAALKPDYLRLTDGKSFEEHQDENEALFEKAREDATESES